MLKLFKNQLGDILGEFLIIKEYYQAMLKWASWED